MTAHQQSTEPVPKAETPGEKVSTDYKGPLPTGLHGDTGYFNFVDSHTGMTFVFPVKKKSDLYEVFKKVAHIFKTHRWRGQPTPIRVIFSDNGGEYVSEAFKQICIDLNIKHDTTIPHTPAQNGISERNHRTMMEMTRAMMFHAKAPVNLWTYALLHSAFILNRLPREANLNSAPPIAIWEDKKVESLKNIPVWFAPAWVLARTNTGALSPVSKRGRFIGISPNGGYIIRMEQSGRYQVSRSVRFDETMGGTESPPRPLSQRTPVDLESEADQLADWFTPSAPNQDANSQSVTSQPSQSSPASTASPVQPAQSTQPQAQAAPSPAQLNQTLLRELERPAAWRDEPAPFNEYVPSDPATAPQMVTRSQRAANSMGASTAQFDFSDISTDANNESFFAASATIKQHIAEPMSTREALTGKHSTQWREALDKEHGALWNKGVFQLKLYTAQDRPIPSKTTYKVKYDEHGEISKFKARLCARGDLQRGRNNVNGFAPVVKLTTIRLLLAIATEYNMHHDVSDIPSAYVNARNSQPTKMVLPEAMTLDIDKLSNTDGLLDPENKDEIIQLIKRFGKRRGENLYETTPALQRALLLDVVKSLYGLTNAGSDWNQELDAYLVGEAGFTRSAADPCLYFKKTHNTTLWVAVFVDDLFQVSPSKSAIGEFQQQLKKKFMLTPGTPGWLLGIRLERNIEEGTTTMSQTQYIDDLLAKLSMIDIKTAPLPDLVSEHLEVPQPDDEHLHEDDKFLLQQLLGALLYLALCTRPDIASAVRAVATHVSEPTKRHLNAAKRILRFIKGTKMVKLTFKRGSQARHLQAFCDASWAEDQANRRSTTGFVFQLTGGPIAWKSKQQTIVALSSCEAEYISLTTTIQEALHLIQLIIECLLPLESYVVHIMEDNQAAITIATNQTTNSRSKHMDIRLHFVREVIRKGAVKLHFCPTDKNIADILTKAISKIKFNQLSLQLLGINKSEFVVIPQAPTNASVEGGVLEPVPLA